MNDTSTVPVKGIIFDYGGTLDSRGDHWSHIIRQAYDAAGLRDITEDIFRRAYVHGERELARKAYIRPEDNFLDLMRVKVGVEMQWLVDNDELEPIRARDAREPIARYCYDYARRCVREARPVLEALSKKYPMVLVSNFYGNILSVLRDFRIDGFFSRIVESSVVGVRKPDPAIFQLGVEALGLTPQEVLVVGDSLRKDIMPARSLGCRTAWLKGRGWDAEEDLQEDPALISSLKELNGILA